MSELDQRIREHNHRLPGDAYVGNRTGVFTIAVLDRKPLFSSTVAVDRSVSILTEESGKFLCAVPIYCFMPDHVHLMVRGTNESSNLKATVGGLKLRLGLWIRMMKFDAKLQSNYYDHLIRSGDDWRQQARYIALNPVRAGFVENPGAYFGTGSLGMNRDVLLEDVFFG